MAAVDVHKFHYAVVSKLPNSFANNAHKELNQGPIDLALAAHQHSEYVDLLRRLGIDILELPPDEKHPECVFVGDVAVVINGTALICKPSARRIGEGIDVFKYNYAIVSKVPKSFTRNAHHDPSSGPIDLALAAHQHSEYVDSLRRAGITIVELPADEKHPECVFVGDVAVVINGTALICKPSDRRVGETSIVRSSLRNELGLRIMEVDNDQAKLEGTDVLFTGKEILVGIGEYTNKEGAQCVAKAFPEYAVTVIKLPQGVRHLQQVMTVAHPDVIVVMRGVVGEQCLQEMVTRATFAYRVIRVDEKEAANVLYVNGVVLHLDHNLIPQSHPLLEAKFDNRLALDYSELLKAGSYLTAAAILVSKPSNYSKTFQTALEKGHHEIA